MLNEEDWHLPQGAWVGVPHGTFEDVTKHADYDTAELDARMGKTVMYQYQQVTFAFTITRPNGDIYYYVEQEHLPK